MIPKIIHYCWFGRNSKSKIILKCIESWRKFMPDYEIIEWNEDNFNVKQNEYVKSAYNNKKWAFVSDYARMKVLYQYGGIYFDTDVELLKPIPSEYLEMQSISCIEDFSGLVSPGLIYACHPNDRIIKEVLDSYEKDVFQVDKVEQMITINMRISEILKKYGYVEEDKLQTIRGLTVFPSEVFCGYDGHKRKIKITEKTVSVHHYTSSWLPWYRKVRKFLGTIYRRMK